MRSAGSAPLIFGRVIHDAGSGQNSTFRHRQGNLPRKNHGCSICRFFCRANRFRNFSSANPHRPCCTDLGTSVPRLERRCILHFPAVPGRFCLGTVCNGILAGVGFSFFRRETNSGNVSAFIPRDLISFRRLYGYIRTICQLCQHFIGKAGARKVQMIPVQRYLPDNLIFCRIKGSAFFQCMFVLNRSICFCTALHLCFIIFRARTGDVLCRRLFRI